METLEQFGADLGTQDPNTNPLMEELRQFNLPDDVLEKVNKSTMLQSDYTRKRQEESERVRNMELKLANMEGRLSSNDAPPQDELDTFLAARDDGTPYSKETRQLLKDYGITVTEKAVKEAVNRVLQHIQPMQQVMVGSEATRLVNHHIDVELVQKYGEEIKRFAEPLRKQAIDLLSQGKNVDIEAALLKQHALEMGGLLQERKNNKTQTQSSRHFGNPTTRYTQPSFNGQTPLPEGGEPVRRFDAGAIADAVIRDMRIGR